MLYDCVLVGLVWAKPMMQILLHVTCSCISHAYVLLFNIFDIFENVWDFFDCLSFSPSLLFTLVVSMTPKHKSTPARNSLHSGASSSSNPTLSHIWFRDDDAFKAFSENFSRRGIHSERQVILSDFVDTDLPFVIHSRGWESLCDAPVTCPLVLIQEFYSNMHRIDWSIPLFFTRVRGTRIPITPQLVADLLQVPRIEFPNYPNCKRPKTVSREELMSTFCERPTSWGERLFTPCRPFAKGPRFINMVMTFVLHPFSYYNSITEPHARFLLSLLEHLTIDFPSHFILSIIDVYLDSTTRDKLIFLPLSRGFYAIFLFLFPHPTTSSSCVP